MVLLHNPEYFLVHRLLSGATVKPEEIFYEDRILRAFEFLEEQVKLGVIKAYGISTNTESCIYSAVGDKHSDKKLSFNPGSNLLKFKESADAAARKVWKDATPSNLKFFQAPFNLVEAGGLVDFELAKSMDMVTMANRPLNSIAPLGFGSGDWGRSS